MRFWDSSTVIPLIFDEPTSPVLNEFLMQDTDMVVWWGAWIECSVTVSRLGREEKLDENGQEETRAALDGLSADWMEVEPANELRLLAMLVSKSHPLKAADCLQLAAALRWCKGDTEGAVFMYLDDRLRRAAEDEGFDVLPERERL
ncbi:MAG TPA: type II toxin-antitoxin system VapC family toxin [Rubrobacteraceae bacterium]|nr:type II toxin-antitoxin system VapC family toxin [Rubrobacteraceae bacterium]